MAEVLEEFITLTPLTCVQQCNALLGATSGKPRSCFLFFTLFGVYCGVLVFRAYRTYSSKQGGDGEKIPEGVTLSAKVDDLNVEPGPSPVKEFVDHAKPILLQPIEFSSTDMRWRYCNHLPQADLKQGPNSDEEVPEKNGQDEFDQISDVGDNDELEASDVAVATSTSRAMSRTHEDIVDGEHAEAKTFSV
ncbi:uncharacterized protein LOC108029596 [Drosophila biarmipes]|uniref:uncharacterized protein LOC108029596 n=1 Tax=Drosophila biarmipes TaxID=125945 RepID=UPI0007E88ADC|nr:uncharacterized protein LOC108029596 [Drosophila biarmipes]